MVDSFRLRWCKMRVYFVDKMPEPLIDLKRKDRVISGYVSHKPLIIFIVKTTPWTNFIILVHELAHHVVWLLGYKNIDSKAHNFIDKRLRTKIDNKHLDRIREDQHGV